MSNITINVTAASSAQLVVSSSTQMSVASAPLSSMPFPSGFPNPYNGPPSTWPDASQSPYNGSSNEPYLDRLDQFLLYLKENPNSLQAKLQFLAYLKTLQQHGVFDNTDVQSMLQKAGLIDSNGKSTGEFQTIIEEGAIYAMFNGYTPSGSSSSLTGPAAATAWLNDLQSFFGPTDGSSNSGFFGGIQSDITAVLAEVSAPGGLATTFGFANGGTGSVSITNADGSTSVYSWPADATFINAYLSSATAKGGPDEFFANMDINGVQKIYQVDAVDGMIKKYKDNLAVLIAFVSYMLINVNQMQIGGLAATTTILNQMTNQYATPLLQYAREFATMTPDQAEQFAKLFYQATNAVNATPQLSSIAANWNTNVFNPISQLSVTFKDSAGNTVTTTLGTIMSKGLGSDGHTFTSADLATALQTIAGPDTAGSGGASPAYQGLLDALQQGGALFTNQSQVLSTQVNTITTYLSQITKFALAMASPTGGGIEQLNQYLVQQQSVTS